MGEVSNQGLQGGDFDLTQFYAVFFEEAGENLASMESLLLEIDIGEPGDEELNAVFRVAHSIKGGAATFGFSDVTHLTHELETLLDRVRRHELALTSIMVDVLLEAGDVVRAQLARHQGRTTDVPETGDLIARIKQLAAGQSPAPAPRAAPVAAAAPAPAAPAAAAGPRRLAVRVGPLQDATVADNLAELFRDIPSLGTIAGADNGALDPAGYRRFVVTTGSPDSELIELFSFHVAREQIRIEAQADAAPAGAPAAEDGFGLFVDVHATVSAPAAPAAAAAAPAAAASRSAEAKTGDARGRGERGAAANLDSNTLRVSVERVDQLINLVGELVITQAMLTQQVKDLDPAQYRALLGGVTDLERNTRDLQEAVMSIRMMPMSFVFNRFPRLIRDLAAKLDKKIELKMVGEATELDKGLIEKIIDPLTHLVRNSADHGIETAERRLAAGKPETGTITLSAIAPGRLDRHRGARRRRGPAPRPHPGQGARARPGRARRHDRRGGLGADLRSRLLDRRPGHRRLRPRRRHGRGAPQHRGAGRHRRTRVDRRPGNARMRAPAADAGDHGRHVDRRRRRDLHPAAGVGHRIVPGGTGHDPDRSAPMAAWSRCATSTCRWCRWPMSSACPVPAADASGKPPTEILVIVEADGKRLAAIVDELLGQHQVVVKNLESNYRRVRDISGATILGDGHVALIIDVSSLVKRARH